MYVPTVLVVDDDDDIRQLAQMVLEIVAGWKALGADGGRTGIEMAREHQPDAILLDMMMPDMDGLETFAALRADEATKHIPVILCTAKARVGEHQVWDGLPIDGLIAKPFDANQLAKQVADALHWTSVLT